MLKIKENPIMNFEKRKSADCQFSIIQSFLSPFSFLYRTVNSYYGWGFLFQTPQQETEGMSDRSSFNSNFY